MASMRRTLARISSVVAVPTNGCRGNPVRDVVAYLLDQDFDTAEGATKLPPRKSRLDSFQDAIDRMSVGDLHAPPRPTISRTHKSR